MTITTKEQLREHIHSIHDYLRNCGAGYGMQAMKIFMLFYGLKIVEPIISETPLNKKICRFSDIVKNSEKYYDKKTNPLAEFVDKDILDEICRHQDKDNDWYHYLFYQIPKNLDDTIWEDMVKYIDEIPTRKNKKGKKIDEKYDVDLSGKVYEYFIGRDATAISELGAYFTNRHITNYIMNKVKPQLDEDDGVLSMIDPFGGSGGFTLAYIQYLNEKYSDIDWDENINSVYHYDMNEDVIKIAGLEVFGLTGKLPNKMTHFKRTNTFKDTFDANKDGKNYKKFYYIFSNPPYGGDKSKKSSSTVKYEKLIAEIGNRIKSVTKELKDDPKDKELKDRKKYLQEQLDDLKKQIALEKKIEEQKKVNSTTCSNVIKNYIRKYDLKTCNDKEACSLVLFMALLEDDGVCAGVLKEGVFFDKKYGSIRKHLVKNFNVKYVISVPQDQFENTSTKTSIVIFEKTGKTKEIIFYNLVVEKEKNDIFEEINGELVLVKNKDDVVKVVEKEWCRCKVEDMTDDYSLNYKKYLKSTVKCLKGFELVKLGDKLIWTSKTKHSASDGKEIGKYRFYTSSEKIKRVDFCDVKNKKSLIIGNGGKGGIFIDTVFSVSDHMFVLNSATDTYIDYIYYYLKNTWNIFLDNCYNGSTIGNISKNTFNEYKIPFPKKEMMTKFEPILKKLMKLHERQQELHDKIPEKEIEICDLIKKLTKDSDNYEETKLKKICIINPEGEKKKSQFIEYLDTGNCKMFITQKIKNDINIPSRAKRI